MPLGHILNIYIKNNNMCKNLCLLNLYLNFFLTINELLTCILRAHVNMAQLKKARSIFFSFVV